MRKLLTVSIFVFAVNLYAQSLTPQVIASSGTSFSGTVVNLDFTIGEVVTSSLNTGSNILTQGFHQPELHFASVENYNTNFSFTLYPNPTEQFITVESTKENKMKVSIYDANGKMIMVSESFLQKITLDVQSLASGTYAMVITNENGEPVHSYSVIKRSAY